MENGDHDNLVVDLVHQPVAADMDAQDVGGSVRLCPVRPGGTSERVNGVEDLVDAIGVCFTVVDYALLDAACVLDAVGHAAPWARASSLA